MQHTDKNTKRNVYCEKLNYITSSYLGLLRSSFLSHPFLKICPENTGGRVLLLVKIQTTLISKSDILSLPSICLRETNLALNHIFFSQFPEYVLAYN